VQRFYIASRPLLLSRYLSPDGCRAESFTVIEASAARIGASMLGQNQL
jgi:hypothetical protein